VPYPNLFIIWEIGPTQYPAVTARASDLRTGELAWWSLSGSTPQAPVLTFEPSRPVATGSSAPAFFEHLSNLFVTHAGCYRLDVTWDGGEWSSIFAVGGPGGP
jgi:hypothetical protein